MNVTYFFLGAAGGFVILAAVAVQALIALFSSVPLTRLHKREDPAFNTGRAYRRVAQVCVMTLGLSAVVTALVIHFAPKSALYGYLMGAVLAFFCSWSRFSPKNEQNRKNYEESYADCFPPSGENPDDTVKAPAEAEEAPPAEAVNAPEEAPAEAEETVSPAPPPGVHRK